MPVRDVTESIEAEVFEKMQTKLHYNLIREELVQVSNLITEQFQHSDEEIASVLKVLSEQQGKMIRPAMVLLCGKLYGKIHHSHIEFSAMVELIHVASLLHDDIIDQADLRRGKQSANARWGNTAAVLLGDFLLSRAFLLAAGSACPGASQVLGQTAQTLCIGELKQNLLKGRHSLSEQDYLQMIEAKTAALFRCSCQLGAMASGAGPDEQEMLAQFGSRLGLAFQIADDLRDVLSSEKKEGKTLGSDLLQEKFTLPVIHWINQDPAQKQSRIEQIAAFEKPEQFIEQLRLSGSLEYAFTQATSQVEQAKQLLSPLGETPVKSALLAFAEKILEDIS